MSVPQAKGPLQEVVDNLAKGTCLLQKPRVGLKIDEKIKPHQFVNKTMTKNVIGWIIQ